MLRRTDLTFARACRGLAIGPLVISFFVRDQTSNFNIEAERAYILTSHQRVNARAVFSNLPHINKSLLSKEPGTEGTAESRQLAQTTTDTTRRDRVGHRKRGQIHRQIKSNMWSWQAGSCEAVRSTEHALRPQCLREWKFLTLRHSRGCLRLPCHHVGLW